MSTISPRKQSRSAAAKQIVHDRITAFCGDDERLGTLMALSVGRVMLKMIGNGANIHEAGNDTQLGHIADWLRAAIVNDDPWLQRLDEYGRPKKLMKFSTIDDIVKEADKKMLKAANRYGNLALVEGDESHFCELDDGYRMIRLLTPSALDRESAEMQHCIGNGSYDERLRHPSFLYLSLRDASGKPHATLELYGHDIQQMQGKQNELPARKYLDKIVSFIEICDLKVRFDVFGSKNVMDINGVIHDMAALPDGLHVGGNLYLDKPGISELPEGLHVDGDLYLDCTEITTLPKRMHVGGKLSMVCSSVTKMPEKLYVGGDLVIEDTQITSLPDELYVGGDFSLGSTSVSALPNGLIVGGNLDLEEAKIRVLPEGLSIGRNLYIRTTAIRTLPERLIVGDTLYVDDMYVTIPDSISDDLQIHVYHLAIDNLMTAAEYREGHRGVVAITSPDILKRYGIRPMN